jgi:hypothetical protein
MKEKLLGISLEEKGNYGGNGLKTTRLREIGHPLIFLCMCMCVCVCVCVCVGVCVCWCVADFLPLLYFLLHFVQSKICFPQTVARAAVIRLAFRPRAGQYTK